MVLLVVLLVTARDSVRQDLLDIGYVAGGVIALGIIWTKVLRPFGRLIREIISVIRTVGREFHPNGGGSMRDAVDRLETTSSRLEDSHVELHEQHEGTRRIVTEVLGNVQVLDAKLTQHMADSETHPDNK